MLVKVPSGQARCFGAELRAKLLRLVKLASLSPQPVSYPYSCRVRLMVSLPFEAAGCALRPRRGRRSRPLSATRSCWVGGALPALAKRWPRRRLSGAISAPCCGGRCWAGNSRGDTGRAAAGGADAAGAAGESAGWVGGHNSANFPTKAPTTLRMLYLFNRPDA